MSSFTINISSVWCIINMILLSVKAADRFGSNFRCTAGDDDSSPCNADSLYCTDNTHCSVQCLLSNDRRRRRRLFQSCSSNDACCDSTIYCPDNAKCTIDCNQNCDGLIVYAQKSTQLQITNCANCDNMEIHCPQTGLNGNELMCSLQIESNINNLNVHTQQSFYDFQLTKTGLFPSFINLVSSTIHCGNDINNYQCQITTDGTGCVDINNECNDYRIPTIEPTHDPTTAPSNSPTHDPTDNPTSSPTLPTNQPTENPTKTPTAEPSIEPTMEPTLLPTGEPTVEPTINPTRNPTTNPIVNTNRNSPNPTKSKANDGITTSLVNDDKTNSSEFVVFFEQIIYAVLIISGICGLLICIGICCFAKKIKQEMNMITDLDAIKIDETFVDDVIFNKGDIMETSDHEKPKLCFKVGSLSSDDLNAQNMNNIQNDIEAEDTISDGMYKITRQVTAGGGNINDDDPVAESPVGIVINKTEMEGINSENENENEQIITPKTPKTPKGETGEI